MSLNVGETLGAYRIVEQLGQGGMATVFKAYHAALDRYVAIKVLHAAFKADPNFQARFQREARVVARLEHPHIVPVYDYAEHNDAPYLVMKFIEGETLKARLQRGPVTAAEVVGYVEALGAALDYAHRQGILHRDIKPSNVMLGRDGHVYLADFGLARIALAGESTLSTDSMLGTPQYMSPEQARSQKELDAGTDLYSLGVVIYELLVGRAPFSADTPFAVMHDHIYTPLPAARSINPNVPEAVEAVLNTALAKERSERYASALELVNAFRAAMAGMLGTAAAIAPERTPPADPTAVTPAGPTVAAPFSPPLAAATLAAPEPAAPTVVRPVPAAPAAAPAQPGFRPTGWQMLLLATGLAVVLIFGAVVLARRSAQQSNAGLPTQTLEAAATDPTAVPEVASLLVAAQQALVAGDADQAVTLLDQAVAHDPDDTAVMVRAGDMLLVRGHALGALEHYYGPASVLEADHPSEQAPVLQAHTALAYYVLAADETAGDFLAQQASNFPDQALPALALYRHYIFFADGAGVEAVLEAVLNDNPNQAGALLIMGDYYLSHGQEVLAARFYQRVADLPRPGNREALDWGDQEARCNLDKLRRLRSAATLETTCEDLLSLLTGK